MSASLFTGSTGLGALAILAIVAVIALLILARIVHRDQEVRVTRFGWFIERERYAEPEAEPLESPWPRQLPSNAQPGDDALTEHDDTKEIPP